ncbi:MAG: hypothetical protein AAF266_08185, partial [Planctomycetota bacterium]
ESTIPTLVRTAAIGCAVLLAANHAQAELVTYNFTFTLDGVTDTSDVTGVPDTLDHLDTTTTYFGSATYDTAAIPTGTSDAGTFTNATYPLVDLSLNLDSPLALDQPRDNTLSLTVLNDISNGMIGDQVQFRSENSAVPQPGVTSFALTASVDFIFPFTTLASDQLPETFSLADTDSAEVRISLLKSVGSTSVPGTNNGLLGGFRTARFTVTSLTVVPEPSAFLLGGLVAAVVSIQTRRRRTLGE